MATSEVKGNLGEEKGLGVLTYGEVERDRACPARGCDGKLKWVEEEKGWRCGNLKCSYSVRLLKKL